MMSIEIVRVPSDTLTGWATMILAFFTAGAVAVGLFQAKMTREAVEIARLSSSEESKSRVDLRSPSVVIFPAGPLTPYAFGMSKLADGIALDATRDRTSTIAIAGLLRIFNEGRGSAVVKMPVGVVVSSGATFAFDETDWGIQAPKFDVASSTVILRPGDERNLMIQIRKTVQEWIDCYSSGVTHHEVTLVVTDTFTEGIEDTLTMTLGGNPVRSTNSVESWVTSDEPSYLGLKRTERRYWQDVGDRREMFILKPGSQPI